MTATILPSRLSCVSGKARLAKRARLNVSVLTQQAIRDELARAARLKALEEWPEAAAAREPSASPEEIAAADAWAADVTALAERAQARQQRPARQSVKRSA